MYGFRFALLTVCGFVAAFRTSGQELPTAKPEDVGMSSQRLSHVTTAVQKLIDDRQVAGAVTVVARRGKIVYFEAAGRRDLEANRPMERDSILRFYSMTKPITSAAVMMLVDEGKIDLDAAVAEYLPEFNDVRVFVESRANGVATEPARRPPTVRDLLRHTAGLTYGIFGNTPIDQLYNRANLLDRSGSLAAMSTKLGAIPLLHQPGTRWNYSISSDLLGRLVEVVARQPFDEFLSQRVFQPLDMRDTGFFVPAQQLDRFATVYGPDATGGLRASDKPETSQFRTRPGLVSGGGGSVSTARDYLRFCTMIANGGELNGKRLLRRESIAEMTKDQLPAEAFPIAFGPARREGVGFGLGFSVQVATSPSSGAARLGEYGWGGAASTHFWISPKDELVVVALQQFMPFSTRLEQSIKPLVYDAIVP